MTKVLKVRYGFATNSSSSHSIIFQKDHNLQESSCSCNFGWDNFTLTSPVMKESYLAVLVLGQLQSLPDWRVDPKDYYSELCPEKLDWLFTEIFPNVDREDVCDGYVDHDSVFNPLPINALGEPQWDLFDLVRDQFLQDGVVILGGNDNSDGHPESYENEVRSYFDYIVPNGWVRKDEENNTWTSFNPKNGTKVTYSTDKNRVEPLYKASLPELVDMKITDYCPMGCLYCYQSSTREGMHADTERIRQALKELSAMGVFEVALGGGETTMHPDFWTLLPEIRKDYRIVPNFTTRVLTWIKDKEKADLVNKYCGGFAFSVDTAKDVQRLVDALEECPNDYLEDKASVQYVLGCNDYQNYLDILALCNEYGIRLTLLGYKNFGFGKKVKPKEHSSWLQELTKLRDSGDWSYRFTVGIDTALAYNYQQELRDLEIPDVLYHLTEGSHSMYIDTVTLSAAPSSYSQASEVTPYFEAKNLLPIWKGITPETPEWMRDSKEEAESVLFE